MISNVFPTRNSIQKSNNGHKKNEHKENYKKKNGEEINKNEKQMKKMIKLGERERRAQDNGN